MKKTTFLFACIFVLAMAAKAQQPTIGSVSPLLGYPGSTVNITGTNFNSSPANNIVYFGATRATVITASATSLTATVPSGATYMPVSVNNTASSLAGFSQYPFMPTYNNSAYAAGVVNLNSKVDFTSGTGATVAAISDIDGDGKPDMAVVNRSSATVSVYFNTSTSGTISSGSFAAKVDFATGTQPVDVALSDIDGDGKPDMVVANFTDATISVFRNTSTTGSITTGSFATKVDLTTGANPSGVAIGDLDADGKADIVVANFTSNTVSVLRNIGTSGSIVTGSFATRVDFASGTGPLKVAIGDIDGDGKPDLATANWSSNDASVFRNTSTAGSITTASFAAKVDFEAGATPACVAIGDFDGDGKPDMAVANYNSANVSVLRNTSTSGAITTGSFATKVDFAAGVQPTGVAIGDFDGNGKPDMAVSNQTSATVSVFLNTSSIGSIVAGSFAAKVDFATGTQAQFVTIGDLDGDGKPDLVVPNFGSGSVSVFRNNPLLLPPSVTNVAPAFGNPGATVTITGTNFNTTPANNIVYFGATRATVTAATTISLTATVPTGATYMPVSLNNTASALTGYSQYAFLPTFDNSALGGNINFLPKVTYSTGGHPLGIVIHDIDGDGKPDLVSTNYTSNTLYIYRNISSSGSLTSSSFASPVSFETGTGPAEVAVGDLDGDGKPDIAVANVSSNNVSVFLNTGSSGTITSSSFAAKVDFAVGINPMSITIADVDNDGKADLAVANFSGSSNSISILRNTGSAGTMTATSFAAKVDFATFGQPYDLDFEDLDGDGKLDLAVATANRVSIYRNLAVVGTIGSGSFATRVDFTTGSQASGVTMGDIDGDGKPEVVVANNSSGTVSVFRNISTPGIINTSSLAAKVDLVRIYAHKVKLSDANGDGKADIFVQASIDTFSVFSNISSSGSITLGSFADRLDFSVGSGNSNRIAIGDLDGDFKPDVAITDYTNSAIAVARFGVLLPPSIAAVSPAVANPGTSVTITGNNFDATPANNIVYFGATKATVTAAGATSLTATVPAGATFAPVSVNNTASSLTGYTKSQFAPKYDNSAFIVGSVNFDARLTFAGTSGAYGVALGDIDGDGKTDLVIGNATSAAVSVYRNISSSGSISAGSFAAKVDFTVGTGPDGVALSDVDGDGKLDLVVSNFTSNTVSVLRNTATSGTITSGSFASKVDFGTGTGGESVQVADLDLDGRPEIIVVNYTAGSISVLRNTATSGAVTSGSFAAKVDFTVGTNPEKIAIGDIDGDGKLDLAVSNSGSGNVSVFRNTTTAGVINSSSFAAKVDFATGATPLGVMIGDIDGDGKAELAVSNNGAATLSVFRNTATSGTISAGSFATKVDIATGSSPTCLKMTDIDGDGKADVVLTEGPSVAVYRNIATSGSFSTSSLATKFTFSIGDTPNELGVGDIDGDGKPEIISPNASSNGMSVLRNNPLVAPPAVASVSPNPANPGTSVTITGTNFNNTPANNIVYFGATKATVTAATATSLNVTVPLGATYMPAQLLNTANGLAGFSQYPFLPKYDNSGYIAGVVNFDPKVDFASGTTPIGMAIADLDGDGKSDMVTCNQTSNTISIYRNTSSTGSITTASFATKVDIAAGTGANGVSIGDIDGDGKYDIIVSNATSGTISVFRNTATSGAITSGSFAAKVDFVTGSGPFYIAMKDIDGDGKTDIAVSNNSGSNVSVFRNSATPGTITASSLEARVDFATGGSPSGVELADIDGDGKPDMIVSNFAANSISVFRNTAVTGSITSVSFAAGVTFATGAQPTFVSVGDFDGDGKQDIAVSNYSGTSLSLFRNTASVGTISGSSFAAKVDFATGSLANYVTIGDIDGDGKPDIVGTNYTSASIAIFRNTATSGSITAASFATRVDFATGANPYNIAIGDLDGDGKPEIVTSNSGVNTISVLRNNPLNTPPAVTAVSHNPANPGTSVTITGTNFNTTPANNIVYFGAIKATVTAAGSTSLTASVPVGATFAPISVLNTGLSITGYSQYPFMPVYDNSNYINHVPNFDAKVDFTSGATPFGVAIGDFDGDGKSDIVTANYNSNTVSVYRNTSTTGAMTVSSFATKVDFATSSAPYAVAIADVNGDGKPDIIASNASAGSVSVLQNTASSGAINTSSFAAKVDFTTGASPYSIAMVDIDGDGKPEIVTANYTANSVSVLRNTCGATVSSTSFAAKVDFVAGALPISIAAADFDGDNKPDLAVANYNSNSVSVFRNTAVVGMINSSSLATKVDFTTGTNPFALAVGDLDGDGKQDIAVSNYGLYTLSLIRNTATSGTIASGSFATKVDFTTSAGPDGLAIADMNGDGKVDIVVSNLSAGSVSVFRNTTTSGAFTSGSLAPRSDFATASTPEYVALGDLDGDSKPDIVVSNNASNSLSVIRNSPLVLPPTVTSVSPNPANPGTSVTIEGTNFNTTPANNIVYFGATKATVTAATATSMNVTVPVGATHMPVSVNNTATSLTAFAQSQFLPKWDNSGYFSDAIRMSAKVDFATGTNPYTVGVADLNGDGKPDLVVANGVSHTISIFNNTSSIASISASSLATKVDFPTGSQPIDVAIGDIDGDGKPDIAVANFSSNTISVYRNTTITGTITSGSFTPRIDYVSSSSPRCIAITDIDKDGRPDLVVANYDANSISIFRNVASVGDFTASTFATRVDIATGTNPIAMAISDFDGDGKPDVATGNYGSLNLSVLRNLSSPGIVNTSSFAAKVDFASASNPYCMTIADFDYDGKTDIAIGYKFTDNVGIYRNTSSSGVINTGSFAAQVAFAVGTHPYDIEAGDINGDGKADLIAVNETSNTISVLRNTATSGTISSASLAAKVDYAVGSSPFAAGIGDIDGDTKPEIIVANSGASSISILRNDPLLSAPIITSVSPNPANPGTSVTITGTNFNTTPANNIVYFGATRATVTAATATSLTATVPVGATHMPVSVSNVASGLSGYSLFPFLPTYDNSQYFGGTVNFSAKVDIASANNPEGFASGDIDGDGKPDLVVASSSANTVSVYRNISTAGTLTAGSFAAKVEFAAGGTPNRVAVADLDGDGKLDIVVANSTGSNISVLRNTATSGTINSASLATNVNFAAGGVPNGIAVADIDGDGKPEIIVVNNFWSNISVLRNTTVSGALTTGSFATKVDFAAGSGAINLSVSDLDGDSRPDIVVVNTGANSVGVFRNTATSGTIDAASLASMVSFTTGTFPSDVVTDDFDGDGKIDIACANRNSNTLSVFRNTATSGSITASSFATKVDFPTGSNPVCISAADVDGNGKPDIITLNTSSNTVSVLRNIAASGSISTSSFASKVDFLTRTTPRVASVCDYDGDGKPDIGLSYNGGAFISVLRNNPLLFPPTVTSVSPSIANPGTSVTISGTNFNTTPANNIVYFGATKATVSAASTTSLTATVPVGATHLKVSVNNNALNLAGYSNYQFLPTYDNSNYIAGILNFSGKVDFTTGTNPFSVALGDLDGDGKADMVVTNAFHHTISVYHNISTSGSIASTSFASAVNFSTGNSPNKVVIADVDGDGKPDVSVANGGSHNVSVFQNTATPGSITTGSLAAKVDFPTFTNPNYLAVADVDGDGKPDLLTSCNADIASVLRNTCDAGSITPSSFASRVDFATGTTPYGVAAADIDGDGKPEMITVNYNAHTVSVFRNTCTAGSVTTASFAAKVDFTTGATTYPLGICIGDIDGDGKQDVAVTTNNVNKVAVFRNTATSGSITSGSLAAKVDFTTGSLPRGIAMGDIDGDGKVDMVVANSNDNTVSVFRNTGSSGSITSGSFTAKVDYATGLYPYHLDLADLDGDHKPEIVVPNYSSNTVSVIRNSPPIAPPTVTNVSPNPSNPGTTVTITGTNFNTTPANNIVYFGATKATVTAAGSNTLTATVPVGVTYEPVTVTNSASALTGFYSGGFIQSFDTTNYPTTVIGMAPKVDLGAGTNSPDVMIADIDGDGKADIVTANENTDNISVYRNISASGSLSSGSFATRVDFTAGNDPEAIVVADFDGDGKPDIAAANYLSNTISIFRNTSTPGTINSGSLAAKVDFNSLSSPIRIAVGDVDGDGKPEIAVANAGNNRVSVFRNISTTGSITSGSFAAKVDYITGTQPFGVALNDLDGDGKTDMVCANSGGASVSVYRNTSIPGTVNSGSFAAPVAFTVGTTPKNVITGDIDADGKPEIITANGGTNNVSILKNTSTSGTITTGSFAAKVDYATGTNPHGIVIGDVNGDGRPDLAIANKNTNSASILRNTGVAGVIGAGTFAGQVTFTAGTGPEGAAIGDLDGDHKPDLVIANYGAAAFSLSVFRNSQLSANTGTATVCAGSNTTLSNAMGGGTWTSSNSFVATVGSATGVVTGLSSGTTSISYTVAGASVTTVITVNPIPTPGIQTGSAQVNVGANVTLTDVHLSVTAPGSLAGDLAFAATNYNDGTFAAWGAIPAVFSNVPVKKAPSGDLVGCTTISPGYFTGNVAFINRGTCEFSYKALQAQNAGATACIIINNAPGLTDMGIGTFGAGITIPVYMITKADGEKLAARIDAGDTILMSMTFGGGSGIWNSLNTSIASVSSVGVVTGLDTGNATIHYSVTNGCGTLSSATNMQVTSPAAITGASTICSGNSISLTGTPAGGSWSSANSGTASVDGSGIVTGVLAGTTTITYTVSGSSATQSVTVLALPPVSAGSNVALCTGSSTGLTASGANTYTWSPSTGLSATVGASVTASPTSTTTYTVNGTNASGCSNTATVTVSVNSLPPVSAGSNVAICTGSSTGLTASGANTYTWSPATGLSATVGASVTASPTSTTTYTVNGTDASGCSNTATVTVSVNSLPPVSAGSNVAICTGASTSLTASGATTYTWSPATGLSATVGESVTASPTSTTTYTVNGTNASGCSNFATVIVSVNSLPPVSAGSNVAICTGSSAGLTASGANTYTWSPATGLSATIGASVTASPTSTTTYTVNGTDASGCSNTATVTVSVNSLPPVSAGSNVAICNGSNTGLTASGANTYTWSPATGLSATVGASVTASPTSTTTYTVNGTNASGCSNTATVTVSVNSLPPVSAGSNVAICTGASTGLTASGATTYSWSPATGLSATVGASVTATPTSTTTYTVNGTNASGCSNTATVTVSVNSLPPVSAGSNVAICIGSNTGLTASGANTYIWSPATGLSATAGASVTASPTSTTTYTVNGTNGSGCSNTATVTVSVNSLPPVSAGSDVAICTGSSTGLTASGANTYTWLPATGLSATVGASVTATPTSTTTYTVNGTNASGCSNTATVTVSVNSLPPVSAGSNVAICTGSSTGLTATGANTYTWSPATGLSATVGASVTATPTSTTTYTVNGTNASGCSNTATVTVSVNSLPPVSAGSNVAICTGSSTGLTASGANTYAWLPATGLSATVGASVTATPTSTTTYTVNGTNASGCSNSATVTVSVNSLPPVSAGSNVAICTGSSTSLTASGATTYTWSPATGLSATVGANVTATPTATTTYTVNGTNVSGCSNSATVTVSVNSLPPVSAGSNVAICIGSSTGLTASGANTYTWSPATGLSATLGASVTATPTGTTTYTVNGTNGSGCSNTATVTVSVNSLPPVSAGSNVAICTGSSTGLTATGANNYTWSPATGLSATVGASVTASPTSTTTYTVNGTNASGCSNTATVTVSVNSLPPVSAGSNVAICTGSSTGLTATGANTHTWSPSIGLSATVGASITATPTSTTTYTVIGTNAGGCSNTATVTVSVNSLPPVNAGSNVAICAGGSTGLTASGANTYTWSPSIGLSATVGASVTATPTSTTTYTVNGTNASGCSNTASVTVSVTPLPDPGTIIGSSTLCPGTTMTLTSSGFSGGIWSSTNLAVATVSASGSVSALANGITTISYTVSNGCGTFAATKSVSVNPTAVPGTITGTAAICVGTNTSFSASGTGGGVWSSTNSAVATVSGAGVVTGIVPGTSVISYTVTNGCGAVAAAQMVTVNQLANPGVISGSTSVCQASSTQLATNGMNGGTWSSTNMAAATVSASGLVTGVSAGGTIVSYTVTNLCGSLAATTNVTVAPLPATPDPITGTAQVCVGNNVLLSTGSTGGVWSSSNNTKATVNASGSVTGISAAVVTISYTISNSCGNAYATRSLTVSPIPATISGNLNICPGALTTLTNSPGGGIWSSPSSTVSVNPTNGKVTGVSPGNALISYTLPAGCVATTTVVVSPPPSAIGGTASVCPGATTLLTNSEPGGSWSSSSPAKATIDAATGVVTGVSQGISNITYTLSAGCVSTTQLTVNAAPAAITGALTLCPGNATDLNSGTTGGVWTSSNTAIATVHPVSGIVSSVAGVGTSNITYTVGTLCPRIVQVTVAVPSPNTGVASVCLGQPISVAVLSNATPGGTWISSNTDRVLISSSTGLLKGLTLGTVIITYQLDPGCFSTTELTVNPAVPSIAGNTSVCPGTTTILTNPQSGGIWSTAHNDIATGSTGGIISGISEGTTTVSYIVSAGCYKTTSFQVYGSISPITGLDIVCQGSETQLTSGAAGGTWTSGNTSVSVGLTTGIVTGVSMGTARITYKLGSSGCFVTRDVTVNPAVATITGTANICPGFTVTLGNSDPGGTWSSSNTARATVDVNTGLVTGISSGSSVITYMVTPSCYKTTIQNVKLAPNPIIGSSVVCQAATTGLSTSPAGGTWSSSNSTAATVGTSGTVSGIAPGNTTIQYLLSSGCLVTREITVNAIPDVIIGSLAVCAGSENSLSVSPSGGVWTSSNVSKASIDAGSGVLTGIAQGTANITYMLSTGCFRKVTAIVNPQPGVIAGSSTVAQGAFVNFTSSPAGGSWSSLASTTASVNATTGRVTGVSTGLTTITYQLSTGCYRTRDITVTGARGTIENPESETGYGSFFQLSPNPTSGTLALSSSVSGVFSVHTIDGKLVVSQMIDQQATTILLPADLAPGTYMCRFLGSDGKSIAQRLVVEK